MRKLVLAAIGGVIFSSSIFASAPRVDSAATAIAGNMVTSIQSNDLSVFVKDANDQFKSAMNKGLLASVNSQFGKRMAGGYEMIYIGELHQQEARVYLWKLTFKDGKDDTLVKMVIKDGKVAGFWLQ